MFDASTVYCIVLLRFHHCLIIIADISQHTPIATWMFVDADTLPVSQQSLVEIIDAACILWQQCLEEVVRVIGCDLLSNKSEADRTSVDMYVYPHFHLVLPARNSPMRSTPCKRYSSENITLKHRSQSSNNGGQLPG